MKFTERFKKDKKYRLNIILIFTAIVLMAGNVPGQEKKEAILTPQADCNQANKGFSSICAFSQIYQNELGGDTCIQDTGLIRGTPSQSDIDLCIGLKCAVGREIKEIITNIPDVYGCFDCVPVGLRATTEEKCCSSTSIISPYDEYDHLCVSSGDPTDPNKPDTSDQCTSATQESLGSLLNSFSWTREMGCKSQFYLVAFGGGFLAFILLMTAL